MRGFFVQTHRIVCTVCVGRTIGLPQIIKFHSCLQKMCLFTIRPMSEVSGGQIITLKICVQKYDYVAAKGHSHLRGLEMFFHPKLGRLMIFILSQVRSH
jgi:hypothetical protein